MIRDAVVVDSCADAVAGAGRSAVLTLAIDVAKAIDAIAAHISRTPTIRLPWLDTTEREIWAKLECWQVTGSVKARAAFNVLTTLDIGQRCVTASVGNHGLALAAAAQALGQSCVVFVPVGASTVRARRIAELGAQVEVAGANLREAVDHAIAYGRRHDLPVVSPFGDQQGAAGLGTCVAEALDDVGPFDTLILPLGSGGLLAGGGAFAAANRPEVNLVAAHPAVFGRSFGQRSLGDCLSQPCSPTLADSLAVETGVPGRLASVLNHLPVSIHEIDESAIALGIFALLHRQNLLVEGAGAAGVGALLTDAPPSANGRTLIILSGGNISSSDLARAFTADVSDARTRQALGLRRRTPVLNWIPTVALRAKNVSTGQHLADPAGEMVLPRPPLELDAGYRQPVPRMGDAASALSAHRRYAQSAGLVPSPRAHRVLDAVWTLAESLHSELLNGASDTPGSRASGQHEDDLRVLHRLVGFLRQSLEWASPAHDQSQRINFFDPAVQMPDIANYARYGNADLRDLEVGLAEMLGFDRDDVELLATSSGMAAYQLIESFLVRHVLRADETVVCTPYVYFEAREQLTTLSFLRHVQADSYESRDLVKAVEDHSARALFVDPVANVAGLPAVDLRELARLTVGRAAWSDRWLVIDGTMISGGINVFDLFPPDARPRVVYYESASKYAQLGLDLHMAGVCVVPTAISAHMRVLRRNTGTVLFPDAVARFPRAGRSSFLARMLLMSANALALAKPLRQTPSVAEHVAVGIVDGWAEHGWLHGGGLVTLRFRQAGLNNRDVLESLIERLMRTARSRGVPLVRGVSFGMSTTRVSAASSTAEFHDPFLRFSVGIESPDEIGTLATLVVDVVAQHLASFAPRGEGRPW